MKNYFKIFALVAVVASLSACDESYMEYDAMVPHNIDCILNMKGAGEANAVLYTDQGINTLSIEVLKTGARANKAAKMKVRVLSDEEVNEKYIAQLIPYHVIPYELEGATGSSIDIEIGADETYKVVNIKVDPTAVSVFMDEKQEANSENASVMKFVLPIQITSETDSVNANNNFKMLNITNVAFPAPEQLYVVSDDFEDSNMGGSIKMANVDNTFSVDDCWFKNGAEIYFCDTPDGSNEDGYYYINLTGKVKIGKKTSTLAGGLSTISLDFDNGEANVKTLEYFAPFQCTFNHEYSNFKLTYIGGKVYSGVGKNDWKDENWSWDNYADTRYKFRAHMSDGTIEEWARHDSAGEVPSDDDVNNWSLETTHFWMANKGTSYGQWNNGQWKYHKTWHRDDANANNIDKQLKISVYFSGSTPTHRIELVE